MPSAVKLHAKPSHSVWALTGFFCLFIFNSAHAYEASRGQGLYLQSSFGTGSFLYHFFGHQPQEARFREYEVGYHGMGATHSGNGRSYGGGFSLSYHLVDKKRCGPLGCPEPNAQQEKNRSAAFSPFMRIEGPEMGILMGVFYSPWLVIPVPRLALRLGPSDGLYFAIEVFNGRTFLSEGILKIGAGGTVSKTQVWLGGDFFPYEGPGFGAKLSRDWGPLRIYLGGHYSHGSQKYSDREGSIPTFKAEQNEFGLNMGLELRIAD